MTAPSTAIQMRDTPMIPYRALLAVAAPALLMQSGHALAKSEEHPATVIYRSAAEVTAAFAEGDIGGTLHATQTFKVNASRRESPGLAEIHARETDVFYVLSGAARFVTGGRVVNARTTDADEIRGTAIDGGEVRELGAGDVIIVPAGVPHWFKEVSGPFVYFVVKPISPVAH